MTEPSDQEAQKKLARTLLLEGASVEAVMSKTTLTKPVILGLKGGLIKAQKRLVQASKPAQKWLEPTEAKTKPENEFQAEDEPETDLSEGAGSHTPSLNLTSANQAQAETLETIGGEGVSHPSPSPSNFVLRAAMTREEWTKYSKMKTADLVSEIADLKAQNSSLQGVGQTRRGNGEGHSNNGFGGENYIDALGRLVDKLSMQKQAEKVVDRMFPSEKNDALEKKFQHLEDKIEKLGTKDATSITKEIVDMIRLGVDLVPRGGGSDRLGDYRSGRQDEAKTFENAVKSGETNAMDLQLELMRENERLDNRKLEFEIDKYERKEAKTDKYIELAKDVLAGPFGKMVQDYGGAQAERVRNQGARIKTEDVTCPRCLNKFRANPELATLTCPTCGASLAKQEQPQPQPSTDPTPEAQPSPGETQQEPEQPQPESQPSQEPEKQKLGETKPEEVIDK